MGTNMANYDNITIVLSAIALLGVGFIAGRAYEWWDYESRSRFWRKVLEWTVYAVFATLVLGGLAVAIFTSGTIRWLGGGVAAVTVVATVAIAYFSWREFWKDPLGAIFGDSIARWLTGGNQH